MPKKQSIAPPAAAFDALNYCLMHFTRLLWILDLVGLHLLIISVHYSLNFLLLRLSTIHVFFHQL